ncbi:MAG: (2Fe-2S)-binding protein [Gammaproteobacteria bacterium]|nr:(2Fe-2S)-binding protein [Gammaproteobacteria bacterium]
MRFDGQEFNARQGETLAVVLLRAGENQWRETASGAQRGPYCLMGSCFECLVSCDGITRQACQLQVEPGMEVKRVAPPMDDLTEHSADD